MLESFKSKEAFEYSKLTEEECKSRGILGRLKGIIADSKSATRNGRLYSKELWENVFEDPIMKEKIANRVCYGELGHPADRTETDMEKIAVCLAEQPKISDDGKVYGVFDILDTPNGRILKTLCDYGTTVGVSSRGTGDLITDDDGNEAVDPGTYDCECWDIVLIPAVESARLQYVTESLDKNTINLKKALNESLNSSSADERKVMEETLQNLGIITENSVNIDTNNDSEQTIEKTEEAVDDRSDEIIKSLQEAIKENTKLEEEVKSLQEKLAVSDTKVNELNEELGRYKSTTARLSSMSRSLKEKSETVSSLEEELEKKTKLIDNLKSRNLKLIESRKDRVNNTNSLHESIDAKNKEIKDLKENIEKCEVTIKELNEQLIGEKTITDEKLNEMSKKVSKSNQLVENYKNLANDIVERYIETKATMLGVDKNEIKNKLDESYTLDDIDKICDDLQSYALNISRLPFKFDKKVKIQVTESKKDSLQGHISREKTFGDDDIDDGLIKMAGLNK